MGVPPGRCAAIIFAVRPRGLIACQGSQKAHLRPLRFAICLAYPTWSQVSWG